MNSFINKAIGIAVLLVTGISTAPANEDEGRSLYQAACSQCHGLAPIELTRNGRQGWEDTVHKMVVVGAQLGADEMELVIDYLFTHYGPSTSEPMRTGALPYDAPIAAKSRVPNEDFVLPAGDGKNLVEGYCVMCHDLGRVVATARKSGVWRAYVLNMLERNSMNITETQLNTMVSYLSQHFGK